MVPIDSSNQNKKCYGEQNKEANIDTLAHVEIIHYLRINSHKNNHQTKKFKLDEPVYREGARRLQREIAAMPGPVEVVHLIEEVATADRSERVLEVRVVTEP